MHDFSSRLMRDAAVCCLAGPQDRCGQCLFIALTDRVHYSDLVEADLNKTVS